MIASNSAALSFYAGTASLSGTIYSANAGSIVATGCKAADVATADAAGTVVRM